MAKTKFVRDPSFEHRLRSAEGSVNPVGNVIREITDQIRDTAIELAQADAREAAAQRDRLGDDRHSDEFRHAKTRAWALKVHAKAIRAVMTGGRQGFDTVEGHVVANYPGSLAIEFGGVDPAVTVGETGEPVIHSAHAHLRRALDNT